MAKPGKSTKNAAMTAKRSVKPVSLPAVEIMDALKDVGSVETIALSAIDLEDRRFQYRVAERTSDLVGSLEREGQLVPVILWGTEQFLIVIDGFRRTNIIRELGWKEIKAIVHRNISEEDAYRLSFVENFKRKSFTPVDIAHAIWKAGARGKSNEELQADFHLSDRQFYRFKAMIGFSDVIQMALKEGLINMSHAQLLHKFKVKDPALWIEKIQSGLTAKALKKELMKRAGGRSKPRKYFKKEKDGFRLYPIRYHFSSPSKQREEIRRILENALAILSQKQ